MPFLEDIRLQMGIRGEVDCGKWNITKQACQRTFVQAQNTKLPDDVNGTLGFCTFYFRSFALYL